MQTDYPRLPLDWKAVASTVEPLVESHLTNNDQLFKLQLQKLEGDSKIRFPKTNRAIILLDIMRTAFFSAKDESMFASLDELRAMISAYFRQDATAREQLRLQFNGPELNELRRKAWRSMQRLVVKQGVLSPAHVLRAIRAKGRKTDDLRSVRGDFDELAHIYIQFFESISYGLAFYAMLDNVANRATSNLLASGKTATLADLCKLKAVQREPLASGALGHLYAKISRVARNKLGHNAAHYDFTTGLITFDNGNKVSLLELQEDMLDMYRLAAWLGELVALIELLAAGQDVPKDLRREPTMAEGYQTIFRQRTE
jgi:hypothetical protein